jgi:hypothetical protein
MSNSSVIPHSGGGPVVVESSVNLYLCPLSSPKLAGTEAEYVFSCPVATVFKMAV